MINTIKVAAVTTMLLAALAHTSSVTAHDGATGVVKQRMDAMSEMAGAMKVMASVVKGKQTFDRKVFIKSGKLIAGHSNMVADLFPEGSIEGSSEALPGIWQHWDDFLHLSNSTKTNAEKLVKMAQNGAELRPLTKQFVKIAGGCKACHKVYRKKK